MTSVDLLIEWSDDLSIGIEHIDRQHQKLVKLINLMYRTKLEKPDIFDTVFRRSMKDLVEYANMHFDAELFMMEKIKYPGIKAHRHHHDLLAKTLISTALNYQDGNEVVTTEFIHSLKTWIIKHISISNKAYKHFNEELNEKHVNGT
jgi:hemerythrin